MSIRKAAIDILKLSFPIILAQLGNVLLGLTDTVMLGQYGKTELAAVGIANQIFFVTSVIGMGVMTALTPIIATSKGANKKSECGEFLRSGIELSLIISFVVAAFLIILSANFGIFGQEEAINYSAAKYLRIVGISMFPMLLFLALKHFNDGLSFSNPAVIITLAGVILNGFLNWVLIFGNITFPALGATGAGIATLFTRLFMALLLVIVVFRSPSIKVYLPPLISQFNTVPVIKKLLKLGLPTGFQIFFEVGAYAVAAVMTGWISLSALAAHQIAMGVIAIFYMVATGISVAGSVRVAHYFGQKKQDLIRKNGIVTIAMTGTVMVLTGLFLLYFNKSIFSFFTNDQTIITITSDILIIIIFFQLYNGLQATATGILRSVEDVKSSAYLTMIVYWVVGIPLAYFLGVHFQQSLKGVWQGLLVALIITAFLVYRRLFKKTLAGGTGNLLQIMRSRDK
ncbi:MATE family efflux transporter [Cytophagaceae bacterium ABcell3]|nr:MATE family efflux transporter [Cytophagaceae bacterium ABcell3]